MNIISKHLSSENIFVVAKSGDFNKFEFFKEIFRSLEKRKVIHNAKTVFEAFEKKEESSSSGIGESIAIPHLRHDDIRVVYSSVFIFKNGVPYNSFDGKDVHLVFLTMLPEKETLLSLAINSTVLRFFKSNPINDYLSISSEEELKAKFYADMTTFVG